MKPSLVLLLVAVALCYDFSDYVKEFNKNYPLEEQWNFRKTIFDANYSIIEEINSQGLEYTVGVNNMTDWTQEEVNVYLTTQQNDTTPVSAIPEDLLKVSAPLSVNWNATGKVTPIRNQGLCGSCWAFAAAAVYESYLAITKNQRYDLSEEYLLECTSLSNCQGGIVDYAFQKVTSGYGMPLESTFPYKAMNTFYGKPTTPGICTTNWKVFNTRYTVWNKYARITKANLQNVLASSPVAAMVYANTAFMNYKSGVFSCPSTSTSNNLLNHAIVIIGYDTSGNWIIKNSWGTNWGVAGYMYLKDSNDCGLKNFVYQFTERKVGSFGSSLIFTIVLLFVSLLAL